MLLLVLSISLVMLAIVYSGAIWLFYTGWNHLPHGRNQQRLSVSVVLAVRNESRSIEACLRSLLQQRYGGRYEVIVVDDASTDETTRMVAEVAERNPAVKLIRLTTIPPGWAPKKYALSEAIARSDGDVILTTDGDCIAPPTWIEGMVRHFEPEVGIVAGLVTLDYPGIKRTLWTRLQNLELFSLFAAAAGGVARGIVTASGANLAYRRKTYLQGGELKAIRKLVSGDDDLLVQQMVSTTGQKMRFSIDPGTIVVTPPHARLGDFFRQRRRWASKAVHQRPRNLFFLVVTFLLNLLLLAAFIIALTLGRGLTVPLVCLAIKMLSELALLARSTRRMGLGGWLLVFPIWELLHIPYVIIMGLTGLGGDLRWKDRRFAGQKGIVTDMGS
jgi:cellulose synthase/poly-beta-1,6-N-acetylglucosamine synthase-like glycosyltransferase